MLQQLVHMIALSIVCIVWGIPVLLIWKTTIDRDDFWYRSFASLLSFLFFCGCIIVGLLSSWVNLIGTLHFLYLAIPTLLLIGYLIFFKSDNLKQIIKQCDQIYFELDMDNMEEMLGALDHDGTRLAGHMNDSLHPQQVRPAQGREDLQHGVE